MGRIGAEEGAKAGKDVSKVNHSSCTSFSDDNEKQNIILNGFEGALTQKKGSVGS